MLNNFLKYPAILICCFIISICNVSKSDETVTEIQTMLKDQGYSIGVIDGKAGKNTIREIKNWQYINNFDQSGKIDYDQLNFLRIQYADDKKLNNEQLRLIKERNKKNKKIIKKEADKKISENKKSNNDEGDIPWWLYVIGGIIIVTIINHYNSADRNKRCAWCDSTKIKFISGYKGNWFWEYRNKDGSRDKRVNDNYQLAGYHSEFKCNNCGATTKFSHFVNKNPNSDVAVWKRNLFIRGEGERKGTDWKGGGSTINTRGENRKN